VPEGSMWPIGYAAAYDDWSRDPAQVVMYPIGIHFVVRYTRELLLWVRLLDLKASRGRALRLYEARAYERGWKEGWFVGSQE
jgi:hypothetical protein